MMENYKISRINIQGVYRTTFGIMTIIYEGDNHYTGWYERDNGKILGSIENDYYLTGTWSESPTYKPIKDAGDFMFEFKSQDNEIIFNGKWGYGHEPMLYNWNGKMIGNIDLNCQQ